MCKHLWKIIVQQQDSIWIDWLFHTRLGANTIWTVSNRRGPWGWRQILALQPWLLPYIDFRVGNGDLFSLWQDPWHQLGPLIHHFPTGPTVTNIPRATHLHSVIANGEWSLPPLTNGFVAIIHLVPVIHGEEDCIIWRLNGGTFTMGAAYHLFYPQGPKESYLLLTNHDCTTPVGHVSFAKTGSLRYMSIYSFSVIMFFSALQIFGRLYGSDELFDRGILT
ncbi:UNVERIFIED_CONTAM: hypothetical protein Sindi_1025900 [Sesamum indicum]